MINPFAGIGSAKALIAGIGCALALWAAPALSAGPVEPLAFNVESTSTRVGLARVNLKMTDMKWVGDRLIGHYDLQVPLLASKNEVGKFNLLAENDIDSMRGQGGKLEGIGIKDFDSDRHRRVKGEVIPDRNEPDRGVLLLSIDTGTRVLNFRTRYHVVPSDDAA